MSKSINMIAKAMPRPLICLLSIVMFVYSAHAGEMTDLQFDGVPLPAGISVPAVEKAAGNKRFLGLWSGRWGNSLNHLLLVQSVDEDGTAKVIYSVGANPWRKTKGAWIETTGKISGDTMRVSAWTSEAVYRMTETGHLAGEFGQALGFAILVKNDVERGKLTDAKMRWHAGEAVFLKTGLVESGKPVKLETIVYRPRGDGPFRLAVINHGSTGWGDDPALFKHSWTNDWLAEFLTDRGFMVAVVQRRGRGQSDGLYDEGFAEDRSDGYTCDADRSLAGADRAETDLHAAVQVLRGWADVADDPILLVGQSRGGALSVAYAGSHENDIAGVINFVGGWLGEGCPTSSHVNQTILNKGASFAKPMLWIYGHDDAYYSIAHNKANFDEFQRAGGRAQYVEKRVGGENNGHHVINIPPLWHQEVETYLKDLK